jgi:hypothetical protein
MRKLLDIQGRILEKKNERNIDRKMKIIDRTFDGFFQVPNILIDEYAKVIGPMGIVVYLGLKRHAGEKRYCWPSVRHLAIELGMSSRTITREVMNLEAHVIIRVDRKHRDYNVYEILNPRKWKKMYYTKVVGMKKASQASLEGFMEHNREEFEG